MDNKISNNQNKEQDLIFYIKIQYRCNSSMQGTIQWMDGKKTSVFRSALELGNLINDAKQKAAGNEGKLVFGKWEEKEIVS
jgi:hypothetical protein